MPPKLRLEVLQLAQEQANQAIGRLDGLASALPDLDLFLYGYVRKEAVLSSQIEGTQSSLSDLLLYEANEALGVPLDDVREVSNYVAALTHGMMRLREGFPLSLRLIREIHGVLLSGGRGQEKAPGEFRQSQNWIGGSRPGNALFVPPPPYEVMNCMSSLEHFIHDETTRLPLLVKAGLIHVQFETIHPFLGRQWATRALAGDVLVVRRRSATRADSVPESLSEDESETVLRTAHESSDTRCVGGVARVLPGGGASDFRRHRERRASYAQSDRQRPSQDGRSGTPVVILAAGLPVRSERPVLSAKQVPAALEVSFPTASSALEQLRKLNILREITGRERGRLYVYHEYLSILSEGTEPLR